MKVLKQVIGGILLGLFVGVLYGFLFCVWRGVEASQVYLAIINHL
jgi:NhaP-type Na+/H+ or K+/H+ antiporter